MKKIFVLLLALATLTGCVEKQEYVTSKDSSSITMSSDRNDESLSSASSSNGEISSNKNSESTPNSSKSGGNEGGDDIPWIH